MTLAARILAHLQAKPDRAPWEEQHMLYLADIVRRQDRERERNLDRKVRRAQAEGWCAQ